ncbi:microtubule-associated protein Jupiter isoform X2 [Culicoides brevitarsis]|uniref:microtubule-associated protein Jupiter isoform X2 n=1 Tax=Culicoides brevitarsis TaxID=469753 RepID=UPI00307B77C2
MSSTEFQSGYQGKSSCKVLKPPGGGSSDIFGGENPQSPKGVKNRMQSNIFAAPAPANKNVYRNGLHRFFLIGDKSRRVQTVDSHNRLFGDVSRPQTPAKNHMKSNIPIGNGTNGTNGVDHVDTNGHAANGKTNGNSNGYSNGNGHVETNGKTYTNGNGVAHTNGHSETGISKIFLGRFSNNDAKTPDSAYGTKSSGSNANIHFTFSQHQDDTASTTNSTNTTSACSSSVMTASSPKSPRYIQRNPVTGSGIDGEAFKPRKGSFRKANGYNPVTGEGYMKPATAEINTHVPALNNESSRDHVINKNRIPPGGFSSGLW